MPTEIHGTIHDPARQHPVLDIEFWKNKFPLGNDRRESHHVDSPHSIARVEHARQLALTHGSLGASVPVDIFVWADTTLRDKPWLTRLGGKPWREKGKPWPKDLNGVPLVFLGQVCFVDSMDILNCKLPGEVVLFFGKVSTGWVYEEDMFFEWSSMNLKHPEDGIGMPWNAELPFEIQGVIHRTVQYTDRVTAEPTCIAAGFKKGGWGIHSIQATSIGTFADLPQGWPFDEESGNSPLLATLSSFYCRGDWPLCDIPTALQRIHSDGTTSAACNDESIKFGIGDVGAIWIYRTEDGDFSFSGPHG